MCFSRKSPLKIGSAPSRETCRSRSTSIAKTLPWSEEDRALLAADPEMTWLTRTIPGGTHCRPEGGPHGKWVKLGWAYNTLSSEPQDDLANEPAYDPQFPEIVMRGAAAFIPALQRVCRVPANALLALRRLLHDDRRKLAVSWADATDGAFMVAALSGFGSMSACAAGKLCAAWVCNGELPDYAVALSTHRYQDENLMAELRTATSKGLL